MHLRTPTTVLAIAGISALLMTGCGSTSSAAGGSAHGSGGSGTTGTATTGGSTATTGASTAQAGASTGGTGSTTAAPSPTATSTSPSTVDGSVAKTGPCAGIESRMVGLPGAASGNTFADLVVTNHGDAACTLPASPRPQYFAANYKPLATTFSTDPSAKPYQLAPGASATMAIDYGSGGNPPCYGRVAFVTVVPSGAHLPFAGRMNCTHDSTSDEGWVAGTYAAPH